MKCLGAHAARYNTRSLMALDMTVENRIHDKDVYPS